MANLITDEKIVEFSKIFASYQQEKAALVERLRENEKWYRLRHWDYMRKSGKADQVEPVSAWLFNSLANKHADMMDNYPIPTILPRERGDEAVAKKLSSVVPVILAQNGFEQTYSDESEEKIKSGTGVYGVFWDHTKLNGLGDISVKDIDIMDLYWKGGVEDIQDSPYLFFKHYEDNEWLESKFPQLEGCLSSNTDTAEQHESDENIDTSGMTLVYDVYYKRRLNGKTILHFAQYCSGKVLYATENDDKARERGIYDHGQYPFVFDVLYSVKRSPAGFGYIDIGKYAQEYIDRSEKAILENLQVNAKPRYAVSKTAGIKVEDFADWTKSIIEADGVLGQDSIYPIPTAGLSGIYETIHNNKIDELKETTGNRDISTGGTASGVTAASAIAAMQEAGSKLSRDHIKASYRCYCKVVELIVELIRQFYDAPRTFRITGEGGDDDFTTFDNSDMQQQIVPDVYGMGEMYREPTFDIQISAQKQSPYTKMAQNELMIQFFQLGFFNPQMADQALACLEGMDFDRKDKIIRIIKRNGDMMQTLATVFQLISQYAQMLSASGLAVPPLIQQAVGAMAQRMGQSAAPMMAQPLSLDGGEAAVTRKARERVAQSTDPT